MALPPPKRSEMGALYLVFGPMELSAGLGYTTQRFKVLLRREMETAPGVCGPGAARPGLTGPAVLKAEAHERIRLALPIDILPPDSRNLALGTTRLLLLPIDRELGEIVGPFGMGLPALDRPRGAAERDAVVVPARGE